jgi:hypothetical protein
MKLSSTQGSDLPMADVFAFPRQIDFINYLIKLKAIKLANLL